MTIDRMAVRKRVTDKIQNEFIMRHTLQSILSQGFIELVEALADELEASEVKKNKRIPL